MKVREERVPAMVPARLRDGGHWRDLTIMNLSAHGVMFKGLDNYPRGHFIEIRRGGHVIVAQVMWSDGGKVGARTQDELAVFDIINDRPTQRKCFGMAVVERRTAPRIVSDEERSRMVAQAINYAAVVLIGLTGSLLVAGAVNGILSAPLDRVEAAMNSAR
ncbi:PilZ domain-containing protein [Sphingomicrobium flavum]|uniref:PilZ domain-containing protein n=1 Tax=Sphingomicrobium flavum TaxID=1229164 RepID=UPI0035E3CC91